MKKTFSLLVIISVFALNNLKAQYCTAGLYQVGCNAADYFSSLHFGSINQSGMTCTSGTDGYNNFTSISTDLTQGNTYAINGVTAYGQNENVKIWIDYNDDGMFNNSTELLYASPNAFGTISDNITVPLTATPGIHRMRVRLVFGTSYFDPCVNSTYGCVNDYTVNILAATPCAGTPDPGNTLSTTSSTCTGINFTLNLQNSFTTTEITYQWQTSTDSNTWTNITNETNDLLTISQSVATYYRCAVSCSGSQSIGYSNPIYITMNTPVSCICTPPTSSYACDYMWIINVTTSGGISDFNNNSGCSSTSYTDYSNFYNASNIQLDTTNVSFSSYGWPLSYSVWIDFNDNGVFEPSEKVLTNQNAGGAYIVNDYFVIPATAPVGMHKMRVKGEYYYYGAPNDPCSQLVHGETEDYAFMVIAATPCTGTPNPGNTISTVSSVCLNDNFTLSLQNIVAAVGITYQWQSSTDDSTWTDILNATNATFTTTQTASTYYRCEVNCTTSQITTFSDPTYIIINAPTTCYCIPPTSYQACNDMWIGNVTTSGGITDFNNSSDCSPTSYTDYSTQYSASNSQLLTTYMTFTSSSLYNDRMAYSVWIDYNDDGVFDPSERVIVNYNPYQTITVTDSFKIPVTAPPGSHRMRVRGEYYNFGAPSFPCNQLSYGETEDYVFTVIAAPPCTTTPAPGNTLSSVSSICSGIGFLLSLQNVVLGNTGLTYQWQSSPDDTTWLDIQGAYNTSLTTSQTTPTYYRCLVSCSAGPSTGISNPIYVTINAPTTCYCVPPTSTYACSNTWIANVTTSGGTTDFNNSTDCSTSSYTDYSSAFIASNSQFLTTTMSFTSYGLPMSFSVWIDFNDDGVFDPSEIVILNNNSAGSMVVTDSFTVPSSVPPGTHRMRVRGEYYNYYGATTSPCNQLVQGETEDYAFTVIAAPPCIGTPNPGNTITSASSVCPGANIKLSLQNYLAISGITYQWQSSLDNSTWTNIEGATYDTLTTSQTIPTYYQCLAICTAVSDTGISNPIYITINPPTACYCIPPASAYPCNTMWITNVTTSGGLSDFNNNPICTSSSYNDYSNSFIASNSQLATTTMSFTSSIYPMAYSVWIDFNDDGIFDASEKVIANNNNQGLYTFIASFYIPITTNPGIHKMRVRCEYNYYGAPAEPCNQLTYGETEDYSFIVIPATPCSGTPDPGNTISSLGSVCSNSNFFLNVGNNPSITGLTYQWQSSPDNSNWTYIQGAIYDTLTTSQTAATYYQCLAICTNSQDTAYSIPVIVDMNAPTTCYCIPIASVYPCSNMSISNITTSDGISDFNNSPNCFTTSYKDLSASFIASNVQLASTSITFTSSGYPMAFSVWIDFNDDGIFDASEMVIVNTNSGGAYTFSDSFTVPLSAAPGTHRMRIRAEFSVYGAPADPCNQLIYGETVDYAFTVIAATPCSGIQDPGNTISSATSVCSGNYFLLSLQNNVNAGGISYQWQSSLDGTANSWTNIPNAIYDTLTISQTVTTFYSCLVTCTGDISGTIPSNPISITMNNPMTCYCIPAVSWNPCALWISNVTTSGGISDFSNTTACDSSYGDYSATYNATNAQLATTTMSFTSANSSMSLQSQNNNIPSMVQSNVMAYSVWIDFNNDGVFEPEERVIANNNPELLFTVTDSFTIPVTVVPGTYRMRVRGQKFDDGAPTDPCNRFMFGETEDYSFTVTSSTPQSKTLNIIAMLQEYYNSGTGSMNQTQGINWDTGDLFNNFPGTTVDTLTVLIRETNATDPNNPCTIDTAFYGQNLNVDGTITPLLLPAGIAGYHYIVVIHRNSIETWSDSVDFAPNVINYNFNTNISQFALDGGMYIDGYNLAYIWGGDVNQNGNLESEDATQIYVAALSEDETVNNGYVINDVDGNGNIDSQDYGLAYSNALIGANVINPFSYQKKK